MKIFPWKKVKPSFWSTEDLDTYHTVGIQIFPKKSKKEYPSEELPVPSHPSPAMYKFNLPIAVYIVYKL